MPKLLLSVHFPFPSPYAPSRDLTLPHTNLLSSSAFRRPPFSPLFNTKSTLPSSARTFPTSISSISPIVPINPTFLFHYCLSSHELYLTAYGVATFNLPSPSNLWQPPPKPVLSPIKRSYSIVF
ncbi:hypothetical protein Salat_1176000 [Sesamum alatum]|uniref:Uncharacterized protein n=1 Tax=Sesamum alatum TaxID=300844 RepID=A0AAE1YF79_9LAMI|nr:hypothetical protein Salat_1176000 [Sesamum alatum]